MIDWTVLLDRGADMLILTANPQRLSGHIAQYTITEDICGLSFPQRPARDRSQPLLGMQTVALHVHDVVDQVDGARETTKDGERRRCAQREIEIEEVLGQRQRREHHEVLRPLVRPQRRPDGPRLHRLLYILSRPCAPA